MSSFTVSKNASNCDGLRFLALSVDDTVGLQAAGECGSINFNPVMMTDGIGASADMTLAYRCPAPLAVEFTS